MWIVAKGPLSRKLQMLTTAMICVIHETPLTSQFFSGSKTPSLALPFPTPQFHHPSTSIPHPRDYGPWHWDAHIFNYPWLHISLKHLHCTAPRGDTVHDLSPNLFICHLLGMSAWSWCLRRTASFVVKSWNTLSSDVCNTKCLSVWGLIPTSVDPVCSVVAAVCCYNRAHSHSERHILASVVCFKISISITLAALSVPLSLVLLTSPLICCQTVGTASSL